MAKLVSCSTFITFEDILRSLIAIVSPDGSGALRIVYNAPNRQTSPATCTTVQDFLSLLQDSIEIDTDGCPSLNVCATTVDECGGNCVTGSTLPEILSSIFVTDGSKTYVQIGVITNFIYNPQT